MRTLSADWMANRSKSESEAQSMQRGEESKVNFFYPRPVAPTSTQVFLLYLFSCRTLCNEKKKWFEEA